MGRVLSRSTAIALLVVVLALSLGSTPASARRHVPPNPIPWILIVGGAIALVVLVSKLLGGNPSRETPRAVPAIRARGAPDWAGEQSLSRSGGRGRRPHAVGVLPSRLTALVCPTPADAQALLESRSFDGQRSRILHATNSSDWARCAAPVSRELHSVLNISLIDVTANAWGRLDRSYLYSAPSSAGEPAVWMVPHAITSVHLPVVEILLGEKKVYQLSFELSLSLELDLVELVVRDGRIVAIDSGYCTAGCNLTLEGWDLIKVVSPGLKLPGRIDLGKGIRVPGL
jgi:hypothetical protein